MQPTPREKMLSRVYYSSLTDSNLWAHSYCQCVIWLAHKPHCWEPERWGLKLHWWLAGWGAVSRQRCWVSFWWGRFVLLCSADILPAEVIDTGVGAENIKMRQWFYGWVERTREFGWLGDELVEKVFVVLSFFPLPPAPVIKHSK